MDELTQFLQTQKILQIAPKAPEPWVANVLMGCESPRRIYFIGSTTTRYGQLLSEDGTLGFATAWHHKDNHMDRKGIQGVGRAVFTTDDDDIETGVRLHNHKYPEFAERITVDWVKSGEHSSGVWIIVPTYIKFWNDELYGLNGSKEFDL